MKWIRAFWQAIKELLAHDGSELAGFMSYTLLVSLFPLVIFLFSLAGFFSQEILAQNLLQHSFAMMPEAVAETLLPIIQEILGKEQPELLTLGVVGTLWAASAGVEALRTGLNAAYDVKETRPLWKRRGQALLMVFLAAAVGLVLSASIVLGPLLVKLGEKYLHLPMEAAAFIAMGRYTAGFLLLTGFLSGIYRFLPDTKQRWRATLPGACLGTVLWMGLASAFSLYLEHFNSYSATYGSLGGVVITLLFLQFTAMIFLLGAEFNSALNKVASPPKPTLSP